MNHEQAYFLDLLLNPWNGLLAFCAWSGIQTLKATMPEQFADGGRFHRTLRVMCLTVCVVCYFIPGPWVSGDLPPVMRVILGATLGTVTTIGHGLVNDARRTIWRLFGRETDAEKLAGGLTSMFEATKKGTAVAGIFVAGISGVYGAWFKPEAGAQKAYEVNKFAVEALADAHNDLDKNVAVRMAVIEQRLAALEKAEQHTSYKSLKKIDDTDTQVIIVDATIEPISVQKQLRLPEAKDLFR